MAGLEDKGSVRSEGVYGQLPEKFIDTDGRREEERSKDTANLSIRIIETRISASGKTLGLSTDGSIRILLWRV